LFFFFAPDSSFLIFFFFAVRDVLNAETHYDVLGVPMGASYKEIKEAFNRVSRKVHPDRNAAEGAAYALKKAKEALLVLSDPKRREAYDYILEDERERQSRGVGAAGTQPRGGERQRRQGETTTTSATKRKRDEEAREEEEEQQKQQQQERRRREEAEAREKARNRRGGGPDEEEEEEEAGKQKKARKGDRTNDEGDGEGEGEERVREQFRTPVVVPDYTGVDTLSRQTKAEVLAILQMTRNQAREHLAELERSDARLAMAVATDLNNIRARVSTSCATMSTPRDLAFVWQVAQELDLPNIDLGKGREALCLRVARALRNATVSPAVASAAGPLVWGVFSQRTVATYPLLRLRRMADIGEALDGVTPPACDFDRHIVRVPFARTTPAPSMTAEVVRLARDPTSLGAFELARTAFGQTPGQVAQFASVRQACERLVAQMYAPNFLLAVAPCVSVGDLRPDRDRDRPDRFVTLACELPEGGTLAELMANHSSSGALMLSLVMQTAMALVAASSARISHGDLRLEQVPCHAVSADVYLKYHAFGRDWTIPTYGRLVALPFVLSPSARIHFPGEDDRMTDVPLFARDVWAMFQGFAFAAERAGHSKGGPVDVALSQAVRVLRERIAEAKARPRGSGGSANAALLVEAALTGSDLGRLVDALPLEAGVRRLRRFFPEHGRVELVV
jgi:curved DNA-binding protein CbpA